MTKKERTAARKLELESKLKIGAFVKNVWGATMQRVSYYEIASIDGNRVGLKPATTSGDASPNCSSDTVTLLGSYPNAEVTKYATIRMGYLIKEGESLTSYWSTYEFVSIGDQTATWSD